MFQVFNANSADEAWRSIARTFHNSTIVKTQNSRVGYTKEILHAAISISDPRQRWVYSRIPAINPAFALAEVIWILAGRNDSALLQFFNREITKYCGTSSTFHGAYGNRIRRHFGFDQLTRAMQTLKGNPDSRQVAIQIWDAQADLPLSEGTPRNSDIPCNVMSLLKVRDDKLEWTQILRSNDVFRGIPYNWVQFTMLQEILAGWLKLKVGSYNHMSDSLHIYLSDQIDIQQSQTEPMPLNKDNLALEKTESDFVLKQLETALEEWAINAVVPTTDSIEKLDIPSSYKNILRVIAAETSRRLKNNSLANEIISTCTNDCYITLWKNWISRFSTTKTSDSSKPVIEQALAAHYSV